MGNILDYLCLFKVVMSGLTTYNLFPASLKNIVRFSKSQAFSAFRQNLFSLRRLQKNTDFKQRKRIGFFEEAVTEIISMYFQNSSAC